MKKSLFLIYFSVIFLVSCIQKSKEQKLNIPIIDINIPAFKEEVFEQLPESLMKNKRYVNLEMRGDENYIDRIDKVLFKNNKFYILDVRKRSLVVFTESGKFLEKVGEIKKDYLNIADFDVDDDGMVYVIDGKSDNFLVYTEKFALLRTIKSPFEIDVAQRLTDGNFLVGLSSWNKENNYKVLTVDKNLNVLKKWLTYSEFKDDNFWISRYRFITTKDAIFYNKPIDNEVYVFSLNGDLKKSYNFNFGLMNVPNEDKKDIDRKVEKYDNYRLLTNFTFVNDKCSFGKIWDRRKSKFFYLDITNRRLYLENLSTSNDLTNIVDFNGKYLTSFIYPAQFNEKGLAKLPTEIKRHLENGGFVLCSLELNL